MVRNWLKMVSSHYIVCNWIRLALHPYQWYWAVGGSSIKWFPLVMDLFVLRCFISNNHFVILIMYGILFIKNILSWMWMTIISGHNLSNNGIMCIAHIIYGNKIICCISALLRLVLTVLPLSSSVTGVTCSRVACAPRSLQPWWVCRAHNRS